MNYTKFQTEHKRWVDRMYPKQTPIFPAAGMVEEAGELMHALLKLQQENVWGPEDRYASNHWGQELVDAVGDCAIYACSLCNCCDWAFEATIANHPLPPVAMFESAAALVQAAVEVVRQPTIGTVAQYMQQLQRICTQWNLDLARCIEATWAEVSRRTR